MTFVQIFDIMFMSTGRNAPPFGTTGHQTPKNTTLHRPQGHNHNNTMYAINSNLSIKTHEDGMIQLANLKAYTVWQPAKEGEKMNGYEVLYTSKIGEAKLYLVHDHEDKESPLGVKVWHKDTGKNLWREDIAESMLAAEEWAHERTGGISNDDWTNASNEDRAELAKHSTAGQNRYNNLVN